jgi:hypothetical protein
LFGYELGNKNLDMMLFVAVERLKLIWLNPFSIHPEKFVTFFHGPACDFRVKAFSPPNERCEEIKSLGFLSLFLDA